MEEDYVGKDVPDFIKHTPPDQTAKHVLPTGHPGTSAMQGLEVTWEHAVAVWWLIIWRSVAGGLLIGAALGVVIGVIGAMLGTPPIGGTWVSQVISLIVGMAWMIVCVRWALQKRYESFRIVLLRD